MDELKSKVEAILFSSGKKMSLDNIAKLVNSSSSSVDKVALDLQKFYNDSESALMLIKDGDTWRINVREKFSHLVKKIVSETEFSKTVMETLAVIAWKAPVLQCDVIKIRTNKAYDHISELEEAGFISRLKKGRTQLIRLSEKFFNYFDLDNLDDVKKKMEKSNSNKQQLLPLQKNLFESSNEND